MLLRLWSGCGDTDQPDGLATHIRRKDSLAYAVDRKLVLPLPVALLDQARQSRVGWGSGGSARIGKGQLLVKGRKLASLETLAATYLSVHRPRRRPGERCNQGQGTGQVLDFPRAGQTANTASRLVFWPDFREFSRLSRQRVPRPRPVRTARPLGGLCYVWARRSFRSSPHDGAALQPCHMQVCRGKGLQRGTASQWRCRHDISPTQMNTLD